MDPSTSLGPGGLAPLRASPPLRARAGVRWALASALLLGFTPIFGKQAIGAGLAPMTVVGLRTAAAALLVFLVLQIRRTDLTIYPVGLVGCLLAGGINGAGSLLYYAGLARLEAGLAQMLYGLYPLFVAALLYLDGQRHGRLVLLALALSVPAMGLLTQTAGAQVDPKGMAMMLGAGLLYALHIPFNERVLYEVPAPTVTLYTLLAMTAVVVPVALTQAPWRQPIPAAAIGPLVGLTAVTFLSRLALFSGVKSIGGLRATLLGLTELVVALLVAWQWLGEAWTPLQVAGGALLALALWIGGLERPRADRDHRLGFLWWLRPPLGEAAKMAAEDTRLVVGPRIGSQGAGGDLSMPEDRSGYVECGICCHPFGFVEDYLTQATDPCPKCHSTLKHIASKPGLNKGIEVRYKATRGPGTRIHREGRSGADWSRDLGRNVRRDITVDKENDLYEELIIDPKTGEILHHVREPLSKHTGHGAARKPPSPEG